VEYITVCDGDLCDCDHDRSEHAGFGCNQCASTWSPDGECRAGGFTNSEIRLEMLTEFLRESFASAKPVETAMEIASESYARGHHN
jgi:hypothetical protein